MVKKDCGTDFAVEQQKIRSIEKVLYGNGTNGLIRTLKTLSDEMIIQKERNSIKMWIYRTTIGLLISSTTFLITSLYYLKFGG